MIRNYRDLVVWQKGMNLAEECYRVTQQFPASELYGLISQIRRASVSIPANVAEGHGRFHRKEFVRYVEMAHASVLELETHLLLSLRLRYVTREAVEVVLVQTEEIGKMLNALWTSLRRGLSKASQPSP